MLKNFNEKYLFYFIGVLVFLYVAIRSHTLGITHDEVGTFLNYGDLNIWTCAWNEACWRNANNHLLNTLLLQAAVSKFGIETWVLRLPNVLSFGLYLIFSIAIIRKDKVNFWHGLFGFAMLCLNPYLLDFFGLARGYGMSIAFFMVAIYFTIKYFEHQRYRDQIFIFIFMIFAVLSNFTLLIAWIAIWAVVFIIPFSNLISGNINIRSMIKAQIIPLLFTIFIFTLLQYPLNILSQKGEFLWGANYFMEMFYDLTSKELYGVGYLSSSTNKIYFIISALLVLGGSAIIGLRYFFRWDKPQRSRYQFAITLIFILICMGLYLQVQILDSKYLQGRKTILFIPVCSLIIFYSFSYLKDLPLRIKQSIFFSFAFVMCYHFFRTMNFDYCKEWEYDKNTHKVVQKIHSEHLNDTKKVTLGVHWLFFPSSEFYRRFKYDFYDLGPYQKQPDMITDFDYFYIYRDDTHLIPEKYELFEQYDTGNLYRLKTRNQ